MADPAGACRLRVAAPYQLHDLDSCAYAAMGRQYILRSRQLFVRIKALSDSRDKDASIFHDRCPDSTWDQ